MVWLNYADHPGCLMFVLTVSPKLTDWVSWTEPDLITSKFQCLMLLKSWIKKKKKNTHTHTLKKKIVDDIFVNYIWFVYWKKIRIIIINFESLIASFFRILIQSWAGEIGIFLKLSKLYVRSSLTNDIYFFFLASMYPGIT